MSPGDKDEMKDMEMLRKAAQLRASGRKKIDKVKKRAGLSEDLAASPQVEKTEGKAKTYKVEAGDTLSGIAEKLLGDIVHCYVHIKAN